MRRTFRLLFLTIFLLTACNPARIEATPVPTSGAAAALYKDPSQPVEVRVADLLKRMTLQEKIGQMTQVSSPAMTKGDITRFYIGALLSGASDIPGDNTPEGWVQMVDGFQREALATRLGIPLLYGIDAIHGVGLLSGATIFPHNVGLGATRDPQLVRQIGQATAEEMLALGVPWNFGPVVAVPQDIRWGRTYEGYSEDTALVDELGTAYIQGLQAAVVLATPKHFIGDGGTLWGSSRRTYNNVLFSLDEGNTQMSEQKLRSLFLPPYQSALDAGVLCVMVSYSSWNGTKMHAQEHLITGVLKGELGFKGFVVSDWSGIDLIDPKDYTRSVTAAINAGVDMAMGPNLAVSYTSFITTVMQAVADGDIATERIDDAVTRILRAKFTLGLFEHPYADPAARGTVYSPAHRELARRAVHESLVLLKNGNDALPLDRHAALILVSGRGADNTGLQSGGWTLGWQGTEEDIVVGSTILDGIRTLVGEDARVVYRSAGNFDDLQATAAAGVVVAGEKPYAEGLNDDRKPAPARGEIDRHHPVRPADGHHRPVPGRRRLGGGLAARLGGCRGGGRALRRRALHRPDAVHLAALQPAAAGQREQLGRPDRLRRPALPLWLRPGPGREPAGRVDRLPVIVQGRTAEDP
jgi:beta-glucosidase